MRTRDLKRFASSSVLLLLIFSAPSLAGALTVSVPGTDIVGVLGVDSYDVYIDDDIRGCTMETSFVRTSGSDSIKEENLRWLQLWSNNYPQNTDDPTQYVHIIDGSYDVPVDNPFYFTWYQLDWFRGDSAFFFHDTPRTNYWQYVWDLDWYDGWDLHNQFELYLVRQMDKTIQILAKITWGYQVDTTGVVKVHNAHLHTQNKPSQVLEQTLAEDFRGWSFTGTSGGDGDAEPSGDSGGDDDGGGGGG